MKNVFLFLLILFVLNPHYAQQTYELTPDLAKQLQSVLDKQKSDLSAAVIFPNGDIWEGVSGFSYDTVSIKKDMLFNIGSITKTFTAAAMLKLADEKKVSLEDPLFKWLPSYNFVDSSITIRQLLSHTSGIFDFVDTLLLYDTLANNPDKIWTAEEVIQTLLQKPVFQKGTSGRYCNSGFLLAGMIISKVTGKNLSTVFRENFFEPLGLNSTFLFPEENYIGEICQFDPESQPYLLEESKASLSCAGAAAGLLSTPEDIVKWAKALYGGKVVSAEALKDMTTFHILSQTPMGYGLGTESFQLVKNNKAVQAFGHDGEWAHRSILFYIPEDSIAITVCRKQDNNVRSVAQYLYTAICNSTATTIIEEQKTLLVDFKLYQNYPNPFNPETVISYQIPVSGQVELKVYDLLGREVAELVNKEQSAGKYNVKFNGSKLSSGIYFYKIKAGEFSQAKKLVLLR